MPLRTKRLFALGELSCGHRARTGPPLGVESQRAAVTAWGREACVSLMALSVAGGPERGGASRTPICQPPPASRFWFLQS